MDGLVEEVGSDIGCTLIVSLGKFITARYQMTVLSFIGVTTQHAYGQTICFSAQSQTTPEIWFPKVVTLAKDIRGCSEASETDVPS